MSTAPIDELGTRLPATDLAGRVRSIDVVRPATEEVRDQIEAFCDRCSDDALFRRFHGGGRGAALRREIDRWVHPEVSYRTVVAWTDGEVHGIANLAIGRDGLAEMAVLVEDAWRRRGVARRLLRRLESDARDEGFDEVHVDIQPDNHPALSLLGAIATGYSSRFSGGSIEASIPLPATPGQTAGRASAIRTTSTLTDSSCANPLVKITPLSGGTSA